jgi:hypothetical protein
MLTGSRDGLLRQIQPISIHGQISCDVYYTDADDPEGHVATARVGPALIPTYPRNRIHRCFGVPCVFPFSK